MKVTRIDTDYWQVVDGEKWYTVKLLREMKTPSARWLIVNRAGHQLDYWARTGQALVNAVNAHIHAASPS